MVSITSHKSSLNSSSFLKLISGFFLLALVIHGSSSLPVNKRQTTESDSIDNIYRNETFWNMTLLARINIKKLKLTTKEDDLNKTTVLCNMYDLYRDYAAVLSAIEPNDPLRTTYSATQYVAWEAMNSACQWINSIDGCTLTSINRICLPIRHHRMFYDQKEQVAFPGISLQNPNGPTLPECASDIISTAFN